MSQQWARDQARIARQNKHKSKSAKSRPPTESKPELPPPISYARLGHLQAVARTQHMADSDFRLPDHAREELEEEWLMMVEEAMLRFDNHLKCDSCGEKHECQQTGKLSSDLEKEMEEADVEEIDEEIVEGFQAKFEEIWNVYVREIAETVCGVGS
ncbi:hypothetical protein EG329_006615 [Mollisiaceae sp. DMI_Dod_QoI]|nr:hypothetical protein EG329_006615 [Helotiales sp. DMI_Dod_QoI]